MWFVNFCITRESAEIQHAAELSRKWQEVAHTWLFHQNTAVHVLPEAFTSFFFFFLRQIYAHIGVFVFTHTFSISISLYALSFSLPSLFLVTVYPVEGSGNTNRLSLPCGFSSSSYPICLLLFLYSSVPYFPSSICAPLLNGCSSIRLVDLPAFCTAP